ncbi:MAG TPA: hypothetical protein VIP77_07010 [Jiangellaceae bacterium]
MRIRVGLVVAAAVAVAGCSTGGDAEGAAPSSAPSSTSSVGQLPDDPAARFELVMREVWDTEVAKDAMYPQAACLLAERNGLDGMLREWESMPWDAGDAVVYQPDVMQEFLVAECAARGFDVAS